MNDTAKSKLPNSYTQKQRQAFSQCISILGTTGPMQ